MKFLVEPPLSLLLVIFLGLLISLRRKWTGRVIVAFGFLALVGLCVPFVAAHLLRSLEVASPLDPASLSLEAAPGGAQAIVVLGADLEISAPEYGGSTLGAMSLERARYGAWLQRRTGLPLLTSGGSLHGGTAPVAELMRDLITNELGAEVRWVEPASGTTWENAEFSARILGAEKVQRVLLVTHAWHLRRARACFAEMGIEVVAAPTRPAVPRSERLGDFLPSARGLRESGFAIHEWVGLGWYRVRHF